MSSVRGVEERTNRANQCVSLSLSLCVFSQVASLCFLPRDFLLY